MDAEPELLTNARVAHLATADQYAVPHVVPIVFAWLPPYLYTPIDAKPKRAADWRSLRRVRNIETNGKVSVIVDRWDEDWSHLAWILVEGIAAFVEDEAETVRAIAALTAKYPQYRTMPLDGCPIVRVTVERTVSWNGGTATD